MKKVYLVLSLLMLTFVAACGEDGEIEAESIELSVESVTLHEGESLEVDATVLPEEDAIDQSVIWESDDESIAEVDDGNITAVASGTTTITATSEEYDDLSESLDVRVISDDDIEAELDLPDESSDDLTFMDTIEISGLELEVAWSSDDTDVIAEDGSVTQPASGESDADVTITATVSDPDSDYEQSIDFTVTVPAETDTGDNGDNGDNGDTGDNGDNGDEDYASDLFISEYIDGGSGSEKAVEIYNGTGEEVDLSLYEFRLYSNGSSESSQGYELSGTLAHDETYVSVNPGAENSALVDVADYTGGYPNIVANFNGNDAIELVKDGTVIDTFGEVGEDPGDDGWTVDDGSTTDHTLVRKASVRGPSETFDPSEWDVYPADTFDYIGSHTME